jgi:hypothetical protein
MPEKTFKEIPPCWRELYHRGEAAAQRLNWDYATEIFHQVLQQEPAFYDCRQALRRTQSQKASDGQGRFRKLLGTVTSSPRIAQARLLDARQSVATNQRGGIGSEPRADTNLS